MYFGCSQFGNEAFVNLSEIEDGSGKIETLSYKKQTDELQSHFDHRTQKQLENEKSPPLVYPIPAFLLLAHSLERERCRSSSNFFSSNSFSSSEEECVEAATRHQERLGGK